MDYPQELLDLFDRYVHGDIDRRGFLEGAKKFAVGGVTATAIWESLRPNYAWAQQIPKDDARIKTESARSDEKAHAWKACLGETLTWVRIPRQLASRTHRKGFRPSEIADVGARGPI